MDTNSMILMAVISLTNILCFYVGAKVGQKASKGEEIHLPNPIRAIEEIKEASVSKKDKERMEINLENIDSYDGTGLGQRDFGE